MTVAVQIAGVGDVTTEEGSRLSGERVQQAAVPSRPDVNPAPTRCTGGHVRDAVGVHIAGGIDSESELIALLARQPLEAED